jgi:hypothetical protein
MVSPKYGNIALANHGYFSDMPDIGAEDYNEGCQIDNAEARKVILESVKNVVDESRIANASERRQVSAATVNAPAEVLDAAIPVSVAPN